MSPSSSLYHFTATQDWFSGNISRWLSLLSLVHSPYPRALEIGSWEGRSAVFLIENLANMKDGGEMVCIDHFDLMQTADGRERHAKVVHNLSLTGGKYRILERFSVPGLMELLEEEMNEENKGFDWIYIDGSHRADDTLLDAELAWRLARNGAIIIFDDYRWDAEPEESIHHPKRGIDAFMAVHDGEYRRLSKSTEYQMILQKDCKMRIGFLGQGSIPAQSKSIVPGSSFEYGINIALVTDCTYALAAAVAIKTALVCTPGRVTVYVIDGGLTSEEKEKLRMSVNFDEEKTLVFVDLPGESLSRDLGPTWAKIDALVSLPVERAIYLDADVLVRCSLAELWSVDLGGKSIGATLDIGLPQGHSDIAGPYFNAGVLLVDLAKARAKLPALMGLSKEMKESKHRDQDALNVHFANDWYRLDQCWNAQGLGTYADIKREGIDVGTLGNPNIVHFTGPVHPSLAEVLNPWVQPYTAKPWGYAGAPGHPFNEEWWAALEQTAWKGLRSSEDFRQTCRAQKVKAIENARKELDKKLSEAF
ncbi:hypothetical protein HGRIS_009170 [Hohenbuehelia grisea]|uniref:Glycosyltransferase family 8 protein n=1 Tax=Hohenbuehelia grisea TaxID=104357 RepID=A0ABR3J1Q0_9AGAR